MALTCANCGIPMQKIKPSKGDAFILLEVGIANKTTYAQNGYCVDLYGCPSCGDVRMKINQDKK